MVMGIEVHQVQTGRILQDRQEEEWSIPTNVGRRENDTERHGLPRAPPPPPAPPTEDRLFTDWSSIDSPRERMLQRNISARNTEPNINQTDNQTNQPRSELARIEAMGNIPSDVITFSSACQQPSQVGARLIGRETNMSEVEVRTQREETRIDNLSSNEVIISNDRDTQMPTSCSGLSSYDTKIMGGPHIRTHTMDMIPQLDDLHLFIIEEEYQRMQELNRKLSEDPLCYLEKDILMRVIAILMIIGDLMMDEGPLEEKGIKIEVEGHWMEEIIMIEVTLEEEDPLMEMDDPLMMEDPLMEEDSLGMDKIQDTLEDEDHLICQDLLDL